MPDLPYTIDDIRRLYLSKKYVFREHMLDMMAERNISHSEISQTVQHGEIIEKYPDDKPFPSCLVIGFTIGERPIHIVCSVDTESERLYMITTYEPDKAKWTHNFKERIREGLL
ncbi:MAG: DUF4258 domain-containing protein [Firmicutes bacterium]|nr:DUF4258 domain-containing protein [Bacillota bacterium]